MQQAFETKMVSLKNTTLLQEQLLFYFQISTHF